MKLDDRDIIGEQDYTTLSNAELVAHIEQYAGLMHNTPLTGGEWLDDILGPARVLLTRAEAAKVERNTTGHRAFNAEAENQRLAAENRRLVARVAELEATLASDAADENQWLDAYIDAAARDGETIKKLMDRVAELEAAQEWRPVTERPAVTAQYQVALQSGNRRPTADHRAYYEDTGWVGPGVIFWRPIPPLPAPDTEPTP